MTNTKQLREWITKQDMRGPWALDGNKEFIRKQLNEKAKE